PDSFSGDGCLRLGRDYGAVAAFAERMVADGADILDIGGESTRPGARPVSAKEEIKRVIPLIKRLTKTVKAPLSIDTYKPEVAGAALESGAGIVNDIMGLKKNSPMLKVLKAFPDSAVVVMHIKGKPRTMQKNPVYADLMYEIIYRLNDSIEAGLQAGIKRERFVVDPGVGFGKTKEHNLTILRRLGELQGLGRPVLVGTSRKSFIGKILNAPEDKRIFGTAASVACAIANGAHIVRVHDVKEMQNVVKLTDAVVYN
ncbi:MAG: dihydropteroate synthase, partial [Candidatus Omnitrophota bacterium]